MIEITVPAQEMYDEIKNEFSNTKECTLKLEHSLVSLHKWEQKWCIPFFSKEAKTDEQTIDYIRCMCITQNVDPKVFYNLSAKNIEDIKNYINAPMTATTFSNTEDNGMYNNQIMTAELIYYWMLSFNIPVEFQKWHINSLMTLIRVCGIKNSPKKQMSTDQVLRRNAALNAQRRAAMNSKG